MKIESASAEYGNVVNTKMCPVLKEQLNFGLNIEIEIELGI